MRHSVAGGAVSAALRRQPGIPSRLVPVFRSKLQPLVQNDRRLWCMAPTVGNATLLRLFLLLVNGRVADVVPVIFLESLSP